MADKAAEFGREIVNRAGEVGSLEDINKWLALAMDIWNATPQPDREGKSAYEMGRPGDDRWCIASSFYDYAVQAEHKDELCKHGIEELVDGLITRKRVLSAVTPFC